jgi:putative membrane protein
MLVLFYFHQEWNKKNIYYLLSIAVIGYLLEVAGVNTGMIFGAYQYGNALGVKLFQTPLLIGLNWLMLIYCAFVVSDKIYANKYVKAIIGALLLLAYDIILEPTAIKMDMWKWGTPHIPLQNYIIWFLFSLSVLLILHHRRVVIKNPIAVYILTLQMGFFLFLRFTL